MPKDHLIWCGPEKAPTELTRSCERVVELWSFPRKGNVHLKLENIHKKLASDLPSIVLDMLEVSSYVYCADQAVSRGGDAGRGDGRDWRRNLRFYLPVREVGVWNRPEVKNSLINTLGFLSDDNYEFNFRTLNQEVPVNRYIDFGPWFEGDDVVLFSGGLDSLAGTIEETLNQGKRIFLVSHRSVAKISKRQVDLLKRLTDLQDISGSFMH
ncbi:MAG: hypothetical protein KAV87_13395, partial [Desulfobacteraceae bacterium]|nr:hypothetical protein [Desulfobacteraceae bacterium]